MLPPVLRYNRQATPRVQQLVAEAIGRPGEDAAESLQRSSPVSAARSTRRSLGTTRRFAVIAANAMHDRWVYTNPRKITRPDEVLEILDAAA